MPVKCTILIKLNLNTSLSHSIKPWWKDAWLAVIFSKQTIRSTTDQKWIIRWLWQRAFIKNKLTNKQTIHKSDSAEWTSQNYNNSVSLLSKYHKSSERSQWLLLEQLNYISGPASIQGPACTSTSVFCCWQIVVTACNSAIKIRQKQFLKIKTETRECRPVMPTHSVVNN